MIKVPKFIVSTVVIIICQITIMSCAFANDRTFKGKVIDFETKEPIEGVVVVAIWYEARATVAGSDTRLKDVKEALTDKSGEWSIVGPEGRRYDPLPGLSFLTGIYFTKEPELIIFKPGYCSWPKGFSINACKGMKSSGMGEIMEGKTVELPKLTKTEDRIMAKPAPEGEKEDWKKQKQLIKLINEERRNLGLKGGYEIEEQNAK
jgi:hypothetical protein